MEPLQFALIMVEAESLYREAKYEECKALLGKAALLVGVSEAMQNRLADFVKEHRLQI